MLRHSCAALATGAVFLLIGCGGGADPGAKGCPDCHGAVLEAWTNPSSHRFVLECVACHPEAAGDPGPGHREKADCPLCHSERSHPEGGQGGGPVFPLCDRCHDPHGSQNLDLVRPEVIRPDGAASPIVFTSLEGYAAGGFAEPLPGGEPGRGAGTGLCETCHLATRTYRRDGTGESHEGARCTRCHSHAQGFSPP